MSLRSVLESLQEYTRRLVSDQAKARAPLLDEGRLRELEQLARDQAGQLPAFGRPASHRLIGDNLSFYRGRGYEFEDNRLFQPGDEPRLLNWRLYARSGELYTRVFTEERREQLFVVADRRGPMRFGTRRQLKAGLAASIAVCYAWQAQLNSLAVGGLIMNRTMDWIPPRVGEAALQDLIRALAAPCPPLPFETSRTDLAEALQLLLYRLPEHSIVILISDFADLDPNSALAPLRQLAERHRLQAIQVLDPVETALPAAGEFLIDDERGGQPLRLSAADSLQQESFTRDAQQRQARLRDCLARCGIPLRTCTTHDDVESCLRSPDADHRPD